MKYRLAGSLSWLACCLWLGLVAPASAQNMAGGSPYMPAYSPGWSMPGGMPPGGMMQPGMMPPQGIPPGMMQGGMPPQGMPPGMASQASYQDYGGGFPGGMPAVDQAFPDGGCAPAGCGDCGEGCTGGACLAGLRRRGLLRNGGGGGGVADNGLLGNAFGFRWMRFFLPNDEGGAAAVRWFDVAVDFLYWTRDDTGADQVFARRGIGPNAPIALATTQLDFDHEPGFRILANLQYGSANSFEFGYMGTFNHSTFAETVSPNGALTSVLSDFATFPAGGFPETDFTHRQRLSYSSDLDSFEVNYRRRWMAPECRYQGSWLMGVRYVSLNDDLIYQTRGLGTQMDFHTNTNNSLTGLQLGGDLWLTLLPGWRMGLEGKAGIYGNYSRAGAHIVTNLPFDFVEDSQSSDAAFIGELNINTLYRLNYNWTLRAGYNFFVMEGVALATDNFNPAPPNGFAVGGQALREPSIINNSDVLFHGMNVGLEYMW